MIVKIHTIHESREQHTQDIPSTDNFEQTIRQNIDGSLKANIYASGITKIELAYDERQAATEKLFRAVTVTRVDDGDVVAMKYDVPTAEMNSILSIKDSNQELCLEKIAQCVNQHCLNSPPKTVLSFSLYARIPSAADHRPQDDNSGDDNPRPRKILRL